ncbi:MAG: universal stress protein [Chloroflexota bacterium]|nr:universal stress protein [Chloroflexota bacterium]
MYQRILVPLDGSALAECVLPHLDTLAKGCAVKEVDFVRVVEPFYVPLVSEGGPVFSDKEAQQIEARNRAEAEKYLKNVVSKIKYDGVKTQWQVLQAGRPADAIADYATKNGADLILIATHGRSGISRWMWGSVADQVLRSACMPVMLVRAPGRVPGIAK